VTTPAPPIVVIAGIAEGLGAHIARTFARAGHDVVGLSRSDRATPAIAEAVAQNGGTYRHAACDITDPAQVAAALQPYADRIAVAVYNAQTLLIKPGTATTLEEFAEIWRVICFGAMVVAQSVLPGMTARKRGAIIFSGATAGTRAGANFAAFGSAKFALRGLAQSLARECGPKGVHVAHVVIDGLIDAPRTDARFGPAKTPRMEAAAVAQAYLDLAHQHPSAWTQEMDLRPAGERF
jgi:NAD(P)-dependent dehydrogenase (short-subunit alcohol dehydrogenase family)